MSVKRRLAAAGMPAAGVTVFAALALTGQPASAAVVNGSTTAGRVTVAVPAPETCDPESRVKCGYSDDDDSDVAATPTATDDSDSDDNSDDNGGADDNDSDDNGGSDDSDSDDNGSDDNGSDDSAGADDDDRGNDGYGTVSPSASPTASATPTTPATTTPPGTDEVPGGESPATVSPSDEDMLPVTGAPVGLVTMIGALLAAAGAAIMFGVRRRRNA